MTDRARLRTIVLGSLALVTVVVLAAGLSTLRLQSPKAPARGGTRANQPPTAAPAVSAELSQGGPAAPLAAGSDPLFYVLAILTVASVVCALVSPRVRRAAAAMLILMLFYTLLLAATGKLFARLRASPPAETIQTAAQAPLPTGPPQWLTLAIAFGLALSLLGVVLFVVQRLLQRSALPTPAPSPLSELAAEAQATLQEIRTGADLRDAVTRCYVEMSRILREQRDIRRAPAMTAHEFAEKIRGAGLPHGDVARITGLFERVRYGSHPPGLAEEAEASACLQAIVAAASAAPADAGLMRD